MFGPCFVMQYFGFFLALHSLDWEEWAGCFTLNFCLPNVL